MTNSIREKTTKPQLIELQQVEKIYTKNSSAVYALKKITFSIADGDFVAIMGPSGSGKSTCMNILACLDTPSSGSYRFLGVKVEELSHQQRSLLRRHYLGFIFQKYNLLNRTSAIENVELPLIYRGISAKQRHKRAIDALAAVGLTAWQHHKPKHLSGGQQQRVAIARAIITKPAILIADEPTGNLDCKRSHEIMQLLRQFNRHWGITIVMVSHEPDMAAYAKRQIHFLDGKLISEAKNQGFN